MLLRCHIKTYVRILYALGLSAFLSQPIFSSTKSNARTKLAQGQGESISIDEFDESDAAKEPALVPEKDPTTPETEDGKEKEIVAQEPASAPPKRSPLPTVDQLVEAKLSALKQKQEEQEQALAIAEAHLAQEVEVEKRTFDNNAYLSLSIKNSAPVREYELRKTEVFVDGKLVAQGGKRNNGMPRNTEIFFGAIEPGCHDVEVRAEYVRLKNDLISRFVVNRVEKVSKNLALVAKNGYRIEVIAEGFESQNTLVNWKRGPAVRFNRSVRPNFLMGAPIVTMDDVLKQGRVQIEYLTEEMSSHELKMKSLSIDGLPILAQEKHDPKTEKSVVFKAPLAEGKHTLNAVLLFSEKKWVEGGPAYNFRLTFNRDFYVISGQSTFVNLTGMPHNGFRSSPGDTRYARAISEIRSEQYADMFSNLTCQEQREIERAREQSKIREDAKVKVEPVLAPPAAPMPEEQTLPAKPIPAVPTNTMKEENETPPGPQATLKGQSSVEAAQEPNNALREADAKASRSTPENAIPLVTPAGG